MVKQSILNFLDGHDLLRRPARTLAGTFRELVNLWNMYQPLHRRKGTVPYGVRGRHVFTDRSRGRNALIVVLAGYKSKLWKEVFGRLASFAPDDADVCVVSSGLRSAELCDICRRHGWSYLSTRRNHVSLAQNLAIHLHPSARWIFKMDEDVFLTDGFYEKLVDCHRRASADLRFDIGFVAPLMPVNGYGHVRVLETLGLVDEWESRFGRLRYTEGFYRNRQILQNPECAKFMWGGTNPLLGDIDALNRTFQERGRRYAICPIRFSIGAILFTREVWEEMGMFPVVFGTGMGEDERYFCEFCHLHSRVIVVAEDTVVGHLGYGPQVPEMLTFFEKKIVRTVSMPVGETTETNVC